MFQLLWRKPPCNHTQVIHILCLIQLTVHSTVIVIGSSLLCLRAWIKYTTYKRMLFLPNTTLWLNPALIPPVLCVCLRPGQTLVDSSSFQFCFRSAWFGVCPDRVLNCFLCTISLHQACEIKCTLSNPWEQQTPILTPAWRRLDQNNWNPLQIHKGGIDLLCWAYSPECLGSARTL